MAAAKQSALTKEQAQLIARALADPRRYEILKKIVSNVSASTDCTTVRDCVDISAATLSHHMRELELAGLVQASRDGKFVRYSPKPQMLTAFFNRLKSDLI